MAKLCPSPPEPPSSSSSSSFPLYSLSPHHSLSILPRPPPEFPPPSLSALSLLIALSLPPKPTLKLRPPPSELPPPPSFLALSLCCSLSFPLRPLPELHLSLPSLPPPPPPFSALSLSLPLSLFHPGHRLATHPGSISPSLSISPTGGLARVASPGLPPAASLPLSLLVLPSLLSLSPCHSLSLLVD